MTDAPAQPLRGVVLIRLGLREGRTCGVRGAQGLRPAGSIVPAGYPISPPHAEDRRDPGGGISVLRPSPRNFGPHTDLPAMSFTKGPSISLTYEQVEELVSQLDSREKERLAEALRKEGVKADWDRIFAAIKPGQVPQREIDRVVKKVRSARQARLRREADRGRR